MVIQVLPADILDTSPVVSGLTEYMQNGRQQQCQQACWRHGLI